VDRSNNVRESAAVSMDLLHNCRFNDVHYTVTCNDGYNQWSNIFSELL